MKPRRYLLTGKRATDSKCFKSKRDSSNYANYGGISLLSLPGKVFNRILLNRIKDAVDGELGDQQAGFQKVQSYTDQIATLRITLEQSKE